MTAPGPLNSICDVDGIRVGNAEDHDLLTGATVILPDEPVVAAVDHRGGAIGSRDTTALAPGSLIETVHAICLSGGSAFGLDAAGGAMDVLRKAGVGFTFGGAIVPIVPSAIIFDLMFGPPQEWEKPVWWTLGQQAAAAAERRFGLGNAGAGLGATAGLLKGGLGSASVETPHGMIGALAIANPVGSTVIPGTNVFHGWMLEQNLELGGQRPPDKSAAAPAVHESAQPMTNTTLAVVATDATLDRNQALRVAIMAQDGLAAAISPVHSPMDGDTVFVLSTSKRPAPDPTRGLTEIGQHAANTVARAIMRGVYAAETLGGFPSYRERHQP